MGDGQTGTSATLAAAAAQRPGAPAVIRADGGGTTTFEQLDDRSARMAALFRERGLGPGDHIAILLDNDPRFFEVCWTAQRSGLYYTPINWHLTAEEAGYILSDCGARVLVTSARFADLVSELGHHLDAVETRLSFDGGLAGFETYEDAVASCDPGPIRDAVEGAVMLYSSGTTGRPKGIKPPMRDVPYGTPGPLEMLLQMLYGVEAGASYLCPAPLYHAAPLGWCMAIQRLGATVVLMERFDAEAALAAIERHGVTHAQFVPTHLVRMLKLPDTQRTAHDLSSLRYVVHAAAPCPVEVKRQILEWFGPIVYEYYAGSEGNGFCAIGPDEWLEHVGSVGKPLIGSVHIVGPDGEEADPGQTGQVWFEGGATFEYHNDPEKTASAFNTEGWSTLGDIGYTDEDGYLYLTDRVANTIISGGVNIYPREIEDVLVLHPSVTDVAVIGVPDPEMGESVLAVIQPRGGAVPDETVLDAHCRAHLAGFKCPRGYRFTDDLPRLPSGKLLKRALVERYSGAMP